MRGLVAMTVVLATVASTLAGVRQHSEMRRLEYRVAEAMRSRDRLAKQILELETAIEETLSPRRLLEERDRRREAERVQRATERWGG